MHKIHAKPQTKHRKKSAKKLINNFYNDYKKMAIVWITGLNKI